MTHNIRLTRKALEGLRDIAFETNYAHGSGGSRRLAPMIRQWAPANVVWTDARPAHVQASDSVADELGLARQWWSGEQTFLVALGVLPLTYLTQVAEAHHIAPLSRQRVIILGTNLTRPRAYQPTTAYARATAVLEAIGAGWLTPVSTLPESSWRQDRRHYGKLVGA